MLLSYRQVWASVLIVLLITAQVREAQALSVQDTANWSGDWVVEVSFLTGRSSALMQVEVDGGKLSGSSQPLDENKFFPLVVAGETQGEQATLMFSFREETVGHFTLQHTNEALIGEGTLFGVPATMRAVRSGVDNRPPKIHVIEPENYTTQYTASVPPILRLVPGDIVQTATLDNEGRDKNLIRRGMPGNTLTGPFFIEGALPGDTLVVHLKKIAVNRDTGKLYGAVLNQKAVEGGHIQTPVADWGRTWDIDIETQTATMKAPNGKLSRLTLPLKPMIGSIGVAPPLNQSLYAGDLGFHGGNLDYNQLTEGVSIHIPVWQAGAYLYLGDGHAFQGDGEISGQGLETSLDVTFQVDVIKGSLLRQVWSENEEYVMISGIENTLDTSLQMATSGMARWLKHHYQLNDSEIATLLSATIEYDIAEIVDPRPHVVAKIKKSTLATLDK